MGKAAMKRRLAALETENDRLNDAIAIIVAVASIASVIELPRTPPTASLADHR